MSICRRCCIFAVIVCIVTTSTVFAEAENEPNAAELVRAIRRSEMWLHDCKSLHLRARAHWTRTPAGIAKRRAEIKKQFDIDNPTVTQFPGLRETSEQTLDIAVDRQRISYLTDDPGYWRQLRVWDGNELRIHEKYYHHDQEHYHLDNKMERWFSGLISSHYGWPCSQPHSFWYDRNDVNEAMRYYGSPEDFIVVGRREYRGVPCYVLENGRSLEQVLGGAKRWFVGRSDGRLYGIQMLQGRRPSIEHWWSDYRQVVPGGWFPMKSSWCFYDSKWLVLPQLQSTCNLEVTELHINEPLADELFAVTIEPGVKVQDKRSGKLEIYKLSPTLLNKPLGPFDKISLPTPLPAKGKPLLIVFVDFDQRPSRHCLTQLANRLDDPIFDRLSPIVIQAAAMSPETLATWRERLKLPMDIGVISGNAPSVRWSWAVKSLPWLILTDAKHIVRAEGFAMDELETKLAEMSDADP